MYDIEKLIFAERTLGGRTTGREVVLVAKRVIYIYMVKGLPLRTLYIYPYI
jgi:hypothetical protein